MKRDSEGVERSGAAGQKHRREQWGDLTIGDTTCGIDRFDPEQFPPEGWQANARDAFVDPSATTGPTLKDRARGERAIQHKGGNY